MSCADCGSCNTGDEGVFHKDLSGFFTPKVVAVVGASANKSKIGYQILSNVVDCGFEGEILPINPKEDTILGKKAYKTILEYDGQIDLVIITVPAPFVIETMEQCATKKVKCVAIITSGFGEVGNHVEEDKIKQIADENGIAFLGPNILGLLYMPTKLNASFGPKELINGKIAFISQSGALAIALMGWTVMEKIGLGALCSLGNKADVDERQLIEYFNKDKNIEVVLVYMEGIKDGKAFMQTKIEKPVIVLKVGRSAAGAKAAASHTGSLAGSDGVYDAVFKQLGMLRANSFTEAFGWARAFSLPLPKGDDTVIITNGGGIGVSTTDECEFANIKLLDDPKWLDEKFRHTMPSYGSSKNPIDITGGGGVEGYRQAVRVAFNEDKIHNAIVLYCETAVTDPREIAAAVIEEYVASGKTKPVVIAMVGGERSREALAKLNEAGVPSFSTINEAVSALKVLYDWKKIKSRKSESFDPGAAPVEAIEIIQKVKAEGRTFLMEQEAREVLELCGVPTPKCGFAASVDEAVAIANEKQMYPLAMKVASVDIVHKTDVGGVILNIKDGNDLRQKYQLMMDNISKNQPGAKIEGVNLVEMVTGIECIVGLSNDPQFGSVCMFGLGGVFVEALKDVAFRVAPFGKQEAERLIDDIKSKKILNGFRGMSADKESIAKVLLAIQKLSPFVKEIDINPLLTSQKGSYAVDARIIL